MMPIKVALQRVFTLGTELGFMEGQPSIADAMQQLEGLTLK